MAFFPMFVNLAGQECLICGGGKVALRKAEVLLDFGAGVTVIAPEICEELRILCRQMSEAEGAPRLTLLQRYPEESDFTGKALLVAATGSREDNHHLAEMAKCKGIPVNAVDQPEDCTFIFPSYIKEQNLVAAFSSGGNSPVLTQYLKAKEKEVLTPELGEINERLGAFRPIVKERFKTEAQRKEVYRRLLQTALEADRSLTMEELALLAGLEILAEG